MGVVGGGKNRRQDLGGEKAVQKTTKREGERKKKKGKRE